MFVASLSLHLRGGVESRTMVTGDRSSDMRRARIILRATGNPVPVSVRIGDDSGSAKAIAKLN